MSRGEGWSLPSFHTVGLGKHAIIHNCSSLKGWANKENAVLVEPRGKVKAVDGIFFSGQGPFNVGNFWNWDEEDFMKALDQVVERKKMNKINYLLSCQRCFVSSIVSILAELPTMFRI
jgi:hypothetical protein